MKTNDLTEIQVLNRKILLKKQLIQITNEEIKKLQNQISKLKNP